MISYVDPDDPNGRTRWANPATLDPWMLQWLLRSGQISQNDLTGDPAPTMPVSVTPAPTPYVGIRGPDYGQDPYPTQLAANFGGVPNAPSSAFNPLQFQMHGLNIDQNPDTQQGAGPSPSPSGPANHNETIQIQMPSGEIRTVPFTRADQSGNANPQLQEALRAGGQPIDPRTNQPLFNTGWAYGGQLWSPDQTSSGLPLQRAIGGEWLGGQEDAYNRWLAASGGQTMAGPEPTLTRQAASLVPGYQPPPGPAGSHHYQPPPNYASPGGTWGDVPDLFNVGGSPSYVGDMELPEPETIQWGFDPEAMRQYHAQNATALQGIGGLYAGDWGQMVPAQFDTTRVPQTAGRPWSPTSLDMNQVPAQTAAMMRPATLNMGQIPQPMTESWMPPQFDMGQIATAGPVERWNPASSNQAGIPQPEAQAIEGFNGLDFLLSGRGYDDPTLTRLNAIAADTISREQAGQLSSGRLAAERAGLQGGGAELAMEGQINREAGAARTEAANRIEIENAARGMQNRITGTGMELGRRQFNVGEANRMASENAARRFEAQAQDLAFQQRAAESNAAAANQRGDVEAARRFTAQAQNLALQAEAAQSNAAAANQFLQANANRVMAGQQQNVTLEQQANLANQTAANQIGGENAQRRMTALLANQEAGNQAGQFNAQQANEIALANAAREFTAMTQNVGNMQRANEVNTENRFQQNAERARQQGQVAGELAANTAQAQLAKASGAETQNAANRINWNLNQAQMRRQRQLYNAGLGENRYSQAFGGMLGLAGAANPYGYYAGSANLGANYHPNLIGAQYFSNIASGRYPGEPRS